MLSIGLHDNIPHAIYHADPSERPSLSSHLAGILLARSPAHAKLSHPRFGGAFPEKPSDEMNVGSIIHGLLLGGGADVVEIDADNYRTKAAQEARDAAYQVGKIPILHHKYLALCDTVESICQVMPVDFSKARTEVTAIWESDGCPCRARLDSLFDDWRIIDLKTCENANLSSEARNMYSFGYHRQAAANIEAVETLIPEAAGRVKFVDLFVETAPPYGVVMAELAGDFRDLGQRQWKRAKGIWSQCLATDTFPSYPPNKTVEAPPWAMSEEMERSIMAAGPQPF
jgi:PDDEXK-like domain of unknown function (DUF3799)